MVKHNSGQILITVVRYWGREGTVRQKEERGDAGEELSGDDGSNIVVKYKKIVVKYWRPRTQGRRPASLVSASSQPPPPSHGRHNNTTPRHTIQRPNITCLSACH